MYSAISIGESSTFDIGLDVMESIVRAMNHKHDIDVQYYANSHYKERVLLYWQKYLNLMELDQGSDQLEGYLLSIIDSRHKNNKAGVRRILPVYGKYKERLDIDRQKFYEMLNDIDERFQKKQIFSMDDFYEIFIFLSNLFCLGYETSNIPINPPDFDYVILANETGHFSFNTYLYILSNKIYMLGIPQGISSYDNLVGCPVKFLSHDITHSNTVREIMMQNPDYHNYFVKIYHTILNDQELSKLAKEELIFILWYIIHEKPFVFDLYYESLQPNYLLKIVPVTGVINMVMLSLFDLIGSYRDIMVVFSQIPDANRDYFIKLLQSDHATNFIKSLVNTNSIIDDKIKGNISYIVDDMGNINEFKRGMVPLFQNTNFTNEEKEILLFDYMILSLYPSRYKGKNREFLLQFSTSMKHYYEYVSRKYDLIFS